MKFHNLLVLTSCSLWFNQLAIASGPPPMSTIQSLRIVAGNGSQQTNIYANGTMQAKVNVLYKLSGDDTVKKVSIKELYTGTELSSWSISDVSNGFANDLLRSSNAMQSRKNTTSYVTKYLTTNLPSSISVCAEIETNQGYIGDTCDGNVNQASVTINAVEAPNYSFSDWSLTQHKEVGVDFKTADAWVRIYTPPKNFKIHSIDYNGAYSQDGRTPKNGKLIFASPTYTPTLAKSQGNLYLFEPGSGLTPNILPLRRYYKNEQTWKNQNWSESFRTTQRLVFLATYYYPRYWEYFLNPAGGSTLHVKNISVYDEFGNMVRIYFKLKPNKIQIEIN